MEKLQNPKNQLLVRDDIGKCKPATRDMPPEGFTYGKPDKKDQENAGVVTSSWKAHEGSKAKEGDRDFKKLNKMGVKSGAIDAKVSYNICLTLYRKSLSSDKQMMPDWNPR